MVIATVISDCGAAVIDQSGNETKKIIPFGSCGEIVRDEYVKGKRFVVVQFKKLRALVHPDDIYEDYEFSESELAFAA